MSSVTFAGRIALAFVGLVIGRGLSAQTTGELAAFSALMVSPIGALPALAHETGQGIPERFVASLRYGGWRYDVDDGDHNNVGITLAHRIGHSSTTVALSAAYLSLDCACSVWASGSVAVQSTLWTSAVMRGASAGPSAHVAVAEEIGGARYTATPRASAFSAATSVELGVGVPLPWGRRVSAALVPGIGYGHIWSVDVTASAWRPLIGGSASLAVFRGLSIDLGAHRVVIAGGPTQYGAGLSWSAP